MMVLRAVLDKRDLTKTDLGLMNDTDSGDGDSAPPPPPKATPDTL